MTGNGTHMQSKLWYLKRADLFAGMGEEQMADRHGVRERGGTVRLSLTQKDLATLIGASREVVAEELARLRRSGLLVTGYRSLSLLHPERLA
ncbi:Crp-like helix-turn-helix protein [Geothermobacter ehrlichii]|uniref:Crp-like helix-turn-helix protein n=1 Tax=Geothermobacter ehrlichii TaxID=213224 RepID=A0A5D3WJJ2_9BACT|nr:helix-turn-helix domain-containing protein [Geothermobacter ehrlichii]TYO98217.1 Crp-like helix-turn-helix protein [Geothermobacter ehrlichii]